MEDLNQKTKVKILVGYHKPALIIKSNVFVPIHLGRKISAVKSKDGVISSKSAKWMLKNMIGDDACDNISDLNRYFCEATALYWAWKNYDKLGDPDYIGFMHYRRHLIFDNKNYANSYFGLTELDDFYKQYGKNLSIDDEKILDKIKDFDVIHGELVKHRQNVISQFEDLQYPPFYLSQSVFKKVIEKIRKIHPDYSLALDYYLNSKEHYWYNCFVMKKDLFFEYASFMFDVLFSVYNEIDMSQEPVNGKRVLAYISERILGVFLTKKMLDDKINIGYLKLSMIDNTNLEYYNFWHMIMSLYVSKIFWFYNKRDVIKWCKKFLAYFKVLMCRNHYYF